MLDDHLDTTLVITDFKQWVYCPRVWYYQHCLPKVRPTTYSMEAGAEAGRAEEGREERRSLRVYGLQGREAEAQREFNVRFAGNPVTVHAARKWLQGESIPTQEKLRALASWLDVPADWLRFGSVESEVSGEGKGNKVDPRDAKLLSQLQKLDEHHRQIAEEFLRTLVRVGSKK